MNEEIQEIVEQAFDEETGMIEIEGEFTPEVLEEIAKCAKKVRKRLV